MITANDVERALRERGYRPGEITPVTPPGEKPPKVPPKVSALPILLMIGIAALASGR